MKVTMNAFEAGRVFPGSVVAIGKFDGLHLGHRKLIALAVRRAQSLKTRCVVVTFDPTPEQFFGGSGPRPLLSVSERVELLGGLGVDAVVLLPFNKDLACMSPEAFARDVIAEQLRAMDVFVGEDFCFGKDRAGRVKHLKELGPELGFLVHPVRLAVAEGHKISSSRIRRLLAEGKRKKAEALLGRTLGAARPKP